MDPDAVYLPHEILDNVQNRREQAFEIWTTRSGILFERESIDLRHAVFASSTALTSEEVFDFSSCSEVVQECAVHTS